MKVSKSDFSLRRTQIKIALIKVNQPFVVKLSLATTSYRAGKKVSVSPGCPACGYRWKDFRQFRFLGCPDCYYHFFPLIRKYLQKTYGCFSHQGKTPYRMRKDSARKSVPRLSPSVQRRLERLRQMLEKEGESFSR